jgi:Fe-S oxidoreductase
MARKFLGIDERRSIPRFERSLWSHLRRRTTRSLDPRAGDSPHAAAQPKPAVILYADCFTAYNEPHIGLAAVRVLEAFGYNVRVLPGDGSLFDGQWGGGGCCGRAMISTGLLADAIRTADSTLAMLRDGGAIDDPGVRAVVVCEPSCLSAIKDDWLQLKLDTPLGVRKALASRSFLIEDFLEKHWDQHPLRPTIAPHGQSPVLLHAHCHQKALWGADSSAAILRRFIGDRLKVLDTGCCGMAGSFGFTADRFDLSMRIANLALMPALDRAPEDAIVCSPGTSCRHQIHDISHPDAIHPIQVIDFLLSGS